MVRPMGCVLTVSLTYKICQTLAHLCVLTVSLTMPTHQAALAGVITVSLIIVVVVVVVVAILLPVVDASAAIGNAAIKCSEYNVNDKVVVWI